MKKPKLNENNHLYVDAKLLLTVRDKEKNMQPIDFNWMSERPKEQQLKGVQEAIDTLTELGYDVSGLSNEDIFNMVEELDDFRGID